MLKILQHSEFKKNRYGAIDGLRTIACFGIVLMHIIAISDYHLTETGGGIEHFLRTPFLSSPFFMVVSAFSMCCGYYERVLGSKTNGISQMSFGSFYKKRFIKILPCFVLLNIIDFIAHPSVNSLYEIFANITLLFGFLPNAGNIAVIGVGWFLGLLFVFYFCFPFFCVLIGTKKRAWCVFTISIIYHFISVKYFKVYRPNILYSGCFFVAGGLLYLYRHEIQHVLQRVEIKTCLLFVLAIELVVFYNGFANEMLRLLLAVTTIAIAIQERKIPLLENRFTNFIASISLEIYLSHLAVLRALELIKFTTIVGKGGMQFVITSIFVIIGSIIFGAVTEPIFKLLREKI